MSEKQHVPGLQEARNVVKKLQEAALSVSHLKETAVEVGNEAQRALRALEQECKQVRPAEDGKIRELGDLVQELTLTANVANVILEKITGKAWVLNMLQSQKKKDCKAKLEEYQQRFRSFVPRNASGSDASHHSSDNTASNPTQSSMSVTYVEPPLEPSTCVAFVPNIPNTVLLFLNGQLEYRTVDTKLEASVKYQGEMAITAIAADPDGSLWTGHQGGHLLLHRAHEFSKTSALKLETAVQAISFDPTGRAWIGGEYGLVWLVHHDKAASVDNQPAGPSNRQGALTLVETYHLVREMHESVRPTPSYNSAPLGQISSLLAWQDFILVELSSDFCRYLTLWRVAGTSLMLMSSVEYTRWASHDRITCLEQPSLLPDTGAAPRWKLFTGFASGQIMLWVVVDGRLMPVAAVTWPDGAVRGVFYLLNMLVVVTANGNLRICSLDLMAATATLPPPSETPQIQPLALIRQAIVKVHRRSAVTVAARKPGHDVLVTATAAGTVRFWSNQWLLSAAENILLSRPGSTDQSNPLSGSGISCADMQADMLLTSFDDDEGAPLDWGQRLARGVPQAPPAASNPMDHITVIKPEDLQQVDMIGKGAYGEVWLCKWNHVDVAAKYLMEVDMHQDLLREVQNQARVRSHPNVARLCGACLRPPIIVTEYYPQGSLMSFLKKAKQQVKAVVEVLTWQRRLNILYDIATAMFFLHKENIIHGDLRSPNIFLGNDSKAKIGDFGLSKVQTMKKNFSSGTKVTGFNPRWVAPEVLTSYTMSRAADVFSFGIIMWEMLTWQPPFEDMRSFQVLVGGIQHPEEHHPRLPPDEELPGPHPLICLDNYKDLMHQCWNTDPMKRPQFEIIASRLNNLIHWVSGGQKVVAVVEDITTMNMVALHWMDQLKARDLGASMDMDSISTSSSDTNAGPAMSAADVGPRPAPDPTQDPIRQAEVLEVVEDETASDPVSASLLLPVLTSTSQGASPATGVADGPKPARTQSRGAKIRAAFIKEAAKARKEAGQQEAAGASKARDDAASVLSLQAAGQGDAADGSLAQCSTKHGVLHRPMSRDTPALDDVRQGSSEASQEVGSRSDTPQARSQKDGNGAVPELKESSQQVQSQSLHADPVPRNVAGSVQGADRTADQGPLVQVEGTPQQTGMAKPAAAGNGQSVLGIPSVPSTYASAQDWNPGQNVVSGRDWRQDPAAALAEKPVGSSGRLTRGGQLPSQDLHVNTSCEQATLERQGESGTREVETLSGVKQADSTNSDSGGAVTGSADGGLLRVAGTSESAADIESALSLAAEGCAGMGSVVNGTDVDAAGTGPLGGTDPTTRPCQKQLTRICSLNDESPFADIDLDFMLRITGQQDPADMNFGPSPVPFQPPTSSLNPTDTLLHPTRQPDDCCMPVSTGPPNSLIQGENPIALALLSPTGPASSSSQLDKDPLLNELSLSEQGITNKKPEVAAGPGAPSRELPGAANKQQHTAPIHSEPLESPPAPVIVHSLEYMHSPSSRTTSTPADVISGPADSVVADKKPPPPPESDTDKQKKRVTRIRTMTDETPFAAVDFGFLFSAPISADDPGPVAPLPFVPPLSAQHQPSPTAGHLMPSGAPQLASRPQPAVSQAPVQRSNRPSDVPLQTAQQQLYGFQPAPQQPYSLQPTPRANQPRPQQVTYPQPSPHGPGIPMSAPLDAAHRGQEVRDGMDPRHTVLPTMQPPTAQPTALPDLLGELQAGNILGRLQNAFEPIFDDKKAANVLQQDKTSKRVTGDDNTSMQLPLRARLGSNSLPLASGRYQPDTPIAMTLSDTTSNSSNSSLQSTGQGSLPATTSHRPSTAGSTSSIAQLRASLTGTPSPTAELTTQAVFTPASQPTNQMVHQSQPASHGINTHQHQPPHALQAPYAHQSQYANDGEHAVQHIIPNLQLTPPVSRSDPHQQLPSHQYFQGVPSSRDTHTQPAGRLLQQSQQDLFSGANTHYPTPWVQHPQKGSLSHPNGQNGPTMLHPPHHAASFPFHPQQASPVVHHSQPGSFSNQQHTSPSLQYAQHGSVPYTNPQLDPAVIHNPPRSSHMLQNSQHPAQMLQNSQPPSQMLQNLQYPAQMSQNSHYPAQMLQNPQHPTHVLQGSQHATVSHTNPQHGSPVLEYSQQGSFSHQSPQHFSAGLQHTQVGTAPLSASPQMIVMQQQSQPGSFSHSNYTSSLLQQPQNGSFSYSNPPHAPSMLQQPQQGSFSHSNPQPASSMLLQLQHNSFSQSQPPPAHSQQGSFSQANPAHAPFMHQHSQQGSFSHSNLQQPLTTQQHVRNGSLSHSPQTNAAALPQQAQHGSFPNPNPQQSFSVYHQPAPSQPFSALALNQPTHTRQNSFQNMPQHSNLATQPAAAHPAQSYRPASSGTSVLNTPRGTGDRRDAPRLAQTKDHRLDLHPPNVSPRQHDPLDSGSFEVGELPASNSTDSDVSLNSLRSGVRSQQRTDGSKGTSGQQGSARVASGLANNQGHTNRNDTLIVGTNSQPHHSQPLPITTRTVAQQEPTSAADGKSKGKWSLSRAFPRLSSSVSRDKHSQSGDSGGGGSKSHKKSKQQNTTAPGQPGAGGDVMKLVGSGVYVMDVSGMDDIIEQPSATINPQYGKATFMSRYINESSISEPSLRSSSELPSHPLSSPRPDPTLHSRYGLQQSGPLNTLSQTTSTSRPPTPPFQNSSASRPHTPGLNSTVASQPSRDAFSSHASSSDYEAQLSQLTGSSTSTPLSRSFDYSQDATTSSHLQTRPQHQPETAHTRSASHDHLTMYNPLSGPEAPLPEGHARSSPGSAPTGQLTSTMTPLGFVFDQAVALDKATRALGCSTIPSQALPLSAPPVAPRPASSDSSYPLVQAVTTSGVPTQQNNHLVVYPAVGQPATGASGALPTPSSTAHSSSVPSQQGLRPLLA